MEGTETTENRQRAHGINSRQGAGIGGDGQARIHKKVRALLEDTNTYRPIPTDPTKELKNRLINILKKMKTESETDENTYKNMYPIGASGPKFYGLPKIHKEFPLRPIVSSIGSVIYGVAKELSRILKHWLVSPSTM